jgi:cation diffusion facilitator CzcD-associated flavoprotein CzcO
MSSIAVQVKTVAVIGSGISGVCTAAHLLKQNLDVVLFERSSIAGGVWHFDERPAADPPYPNEKPSSSDYIRAIRGENGYQTPPKTPDPAGDTSKHGVYLDYAEAKLPVALSDLEISHAPPGPCYAGLKNNVCLRQMKTTLGEWPDGLEDFVNQRYLEQYIQAVAHSNGVNRITEYNTRVEEVTKTEGKSKWRVHTTTLGRLGAGDGASARLIERHWSFDAVVVASGHYNMPRIPDIPGLTQWKARFPDRVWHSKRYRYPALFKDKRVLLIGAGVSSNDIAKESDGFATKIFQSSRGRRLGFTGLNATSKRGQDRRHKTLRP